MSNAQTAVLEPNEFHSEEVKNGPPLRVYAGFRLSLPMDSHLEMQALTHRCDKSVILRQAVHEYFERRGIDAWLPA